MRPRLTYYLVLFFSSPYGHERSRRRASARRGKAPLLPGTKDPCTAPMFTRFSTQSGLPGYLYTRPVRAGYTRSNLPTGIYYPCCCYPIFGVEILPVVGYFWYLTQHRSRNHCVLNPSLGVFFTSMPILLPLRSKHTLSLFFVLTPILLPVRSKHTLIMFFILMPILTTTAF